MSTIKSSDEHLTLNADGSSKDIKFQANGVEKASISSAGAFTSTTIDATKLTGNLPAVNASALTNLTAANLTGALPAISGAALTGISGGLSEADHWRINAGFTPANPTDMTTNWERPDTGGGGGYVGTGMSEAAGVWTFPSTGQYLIDFHLMASSTADVRYIRALINTTTNNGSAWYVAADGRGSLNPETSYWYTGVRATFLFDVTNVSTHKVKFSAGGENTNVSINGDSNGNETYVTFLKLGET